MKRIAFIIYRKWAYEIYKNIIAFQKERDGFLVPVLITTLSPEFEIENNNFTKIYSINQKDHEKIALILSENKIDVICYYGWSWLVKEPILSKYICLCLHPSPLPKYRGGSPIQNQVMAGEKDGAVSVFKMGGGLDDGDIYKQLPMSLEGTLNDIFTRMINLGTSITQQFILDLIEDKVIFTPQQFLEKNPPFKRRKKEQSEILLENISSFSYLELYDMIRVLADPYPNAFITFSNGKLLLQEIKKCEEVPRNGIVLNDGAIKTIKEENLPFYLHLKYEYALITKYKFELTKSI